MNATMRQVREIAVTVMDIVCAPGEISEERRGAIEEINVANKKLVEQICDDLRAPKRPGALSRVPDHTELSPTATELFTELKRKLLAAV